MSELKFNRKTLTKDALKGDSGTIYFTPDEHKIVMSGNVYGQSFPSDQLEFLNSLWEDHQKSLWTTNIGISNNPCLPGTEVTVTLTSKVSGVSVSLDSLPIPTFGWLAGSRFTERTPGVYVTTVRVTTPGSLSSTVEVTYNGWRRVLTIGLGCYGEVIWGWSTLPEITTLTDIRGARTRGPAKMMTGDYEFSSSQVGWYYFLIPTGTQFQVSPDITEGPIPAYFQLQSEGLPGYTVYRISDMQAPGDHLFTWH